MRAPAVVDPDRERRVNLPARLERRLRKLEAMAHPPAPIEDVVDEVLMRRGLIRRPPEAVRCPGCGEPSDVVIKNAVGTTIGYECTRCSYRLESE